MGSGKIGILIVDDSAVVRQVLTSVFHTDPDLEVIGAVSDPIFAMRVMDEQWPDVIVLDIEMPRMDGLTFLRNLMKTRPVPVVVCSSLTVKGASTTLEALSAGAVEVISKPTTALRDYFNQSTRDLLLSVKAAAASIPKLQVKTTEKLANVIATSGIADGSGALSSTTDRLIAIGSSTGGTVALETLLRTLPITTPGIVVVQHMPANFTAAFAQRLNEICTLKVLEAEDRIRILPGYVYIARGGTHLQVVRQGGYYYTCLKDGPPVSRHKPSVNVLFNSVAVAAGANAAGFILTGMGDDGARGLLEMRNAGSTTFAQDEDSCVVFGMPKEAIEMGGVSRVLSLEDMPRYMR